MIYSRSGLALTEFFEGCRLIAYQDGGGVWTIGYGHTHDVRMGDTCTQAQAEYWLQSDLALATAWVNHLVTVPLTQGEFDALVDFVFNCGPRAFRTSTMLRKINAGDFAGAAGEFEKWSHVCGEICSGVLKRRDAEREMFAPSKPLMPSGNAGQ